MKLQKYLSQPNVRLVAALLLVAGVGVLIGRYYVCSCIEQKIDPKVIEDAKKGKVAAQRYIVRQKVRQEQVKKSSDFIIGSVIALATLMLVASFLGGVESKVKSKTTLYSKRRRKLSK